MASRRFYSVLLPGGLFVTIAVLLTASGQVPQPLLPYLPLFFPLVFAAGLLLGWRFSRTRLVFTLLLHALALGLPLLFPQNADLVRALALLLPLNLALVVLLPEKGFASSYCALFGSLLLLQLLGGAWLAPRFHALLPAPLLRPLPAAGELSSAQLAVSLIATLVIGGTLYRRPQPLEAAFFWAIPLSALPLRAGTSQPQLLLGFGLCALNLLTGLIETSHNMAYRDELTGIPGRRALDEALHRLGSRYCLAMLDIDHFKTFNDRHGHDVGDQVLKMVASRLAAVGAGGRAFRYGGEEFALLFPRRSLEQTLPQLEKLRQAIADSRFIPRGKDRPAQKPRKKPQKSHGRTALSVTISIGAATPARDRRSARQVLVAADQALYRAKQQGRNRVCH